MLPDAWPPTHSLIAPSRARLHYSEARMRSLLFLFALATANLLPAQQPTTHALFNHSTDIGPTRKGATAYDLSSGDYRLTGGGADMWGTSDAFHFAWTRLAGDATLSADVTFPQTGVLPLEKGVLILRQSLDPAAPYADVAIHGDGHITLQFRGSRAAKTEDITAPPGLASRIRIERHGDTLTAFAGPNDRALTRIASTTLAFHGPAYFGLGVCAHNANGLVTLTFSHVELEHTALNGRARE